MQRTDVKHLTLLLGAISMVLALGLTGCGDDDSTCTEGDARCTDGKLQKCTANGTWGEAEACPEEQHCMTMDSGLTHCMKHGVDGTDGTDHSGHDGTDGTDHSGHDGTDSTDGTDHSGHDGTDGTDHSGHDGTDGTDGTDHSGHDGTDHAGSDSGNDDSADSTN